MQRVQSWSESLDDQSACVSQVVQLQVPVGAAGYAHAVRHDGTVFVHPAASYTEPDMPLAAHHAKS